MVSNDDYIISKKNLNKLNKLLEKRRQNYSIALITWIKEFYWRDFIVSKSTLIPRPETEILIDSVLNKILLIKNDNIRILDIWTWTWCIAITLYREIKDKFNFQKIQITASDISSRALLVAEKNANKYSTKIYFIKSNLLKDIKWNKYNIITANLPYVPVKDKNEEIEKEPSLALYSWEDWLKHYRRLAKELEQKNIKFDLLFLEIAHFQKDEIIKIFSKFWKNEIIKDLAGKNRIVIVQKINK